MIIWVRTAMSRAVGALVAGLAAWLLLHFGVALDHEVQARLSEAILVVTMVFFNIVYAFVHKWLNSRFNPADSASKVSE